MSLLKGTLMPFNLDQHTTANYYLYMVTKMHT